MKGVFTITMSVERSSLTNLNSKMTKPVTAVKDLGRTRKLDADERIKRLELAVVKLVRQATSPSFDALDAMVRYTIGLVKASKGKYIISGEPLPKVDSFIIPVYGVSACMAYMKAAIATDHELVMRFNQFRFFWREIDTFLELAEHVKRRKMRRKFAKGFRRYLLRRARPVRKRT